MSGASESVSAPWPPEERVIGTDNALKVRFFATVGEEPEVELALV